jgi:hypothetical protein
MLQKRGKNELSLVVTFVCLIQFPHNGNRMGGSVLVLLQTGWLLARRIGWLPEKQHHPGQGLTEIWASVPPDPLTAREIVRGRSLTLLPLLLSPPSPLQPAPPTAHLDSNLATARPPARL